MTIKSDRWIRRMAEQQKMIEPFEAGQVKQNGGHRLISYGTSSYGYDVRCADEFKVFTNINSTIVDPSAVSSTSNPTSASFRRTRLRSHARSNTSAFHARC
jgi:dCTP deaminase